MHNKISFTNISGVGAAERRVVPGAGPDQFDFGSFMSVTLSCDHRVIDGNLQLLLR